MAEPKLISLDTVLKEDVAICPKCGVLFVKTLRDEEWSLLEGTGIYCPVCGSLVVETDEEE